ncbi:OmpH family outer membrane protein [Alkalilacustris brevis]|uniref:OmpH family outer membrane protein n=1 Tax=Alkalilacustris brevis TaxID=2026338 RepID=UPI000E0CF92F|nr:OmpH family outer membrane protein [Alkalilacustris brevis]
MHGKRGFALAAALAAAVAPAGLRAQLPDGPFPLGEQAQPERPQSPVLTLDQERLFEESAFGVRVFDQLEAASRALAAENRRLEEQLSAEERTLTEERPLLPPEEFRALADDFDQMVQQIRREQEAKSVALAQFRDAERQRFFELALPVLSQIVLEAGAVAVLDNRAIFLVAAPIDMTDEAIERIDDTIGTARDGAPDELLPQIDLPPDDAQPSQPPAPALPPEGGPPLELPNPADPD